MSDHHMLRLHEKVTLLEGRVAKLEAALRGCLETMAMQERRETGEFHIPSDVAWELWSAAVTAGLRALEDK